LTALVNVPPDKGEGATRRLRLQAARCWNREPPRIRRILMWSLAFDFGNLPLLNVALPQGDHFAYFARVHLLI
jgi:hypothetical protein